MGKRESTWDVRTREPDDRERVLFIGTQFSILYTSMYSTDLVLHLVKRES